MTFSEVPRLNEDDYEFDERERTAACGVEQPRRVLAFGPNGSMTLDATHGKTVVIGRGTDCDMRIQDASISRRHAVLYFSPTLAIEDCGSTNGTMVGAVRVPVGHRAEFGPSTVISVGNVRIFLEGVGPTESGAGTASRDPTERSTFRPGTTTTLAAETKMGRLERLLDLVSKSMLSVLLVGETGVGKEVAAERLHASSGRSAGPLVKLNCAAIPEQLLESELFGYERGAFTGADKTKPGLVEVSDGGTLFLDEVGEVPLGTQAKLLRVLEAREVLRLGSLKPRPVDLRVVAATNRDLEALVREGKFRSDLYFRLNGITLEIPPLRERRQELESYAETFLQDAWKRRARPVVSGISPAAMQLLMSHSWPGNLRELRNVIERAVVLAGGGVVDHEHIMLQASGAAQTGSDRVWPTADLATSSPPSSVRPLPEPTKERDRIMEALALAVGNQTEAAKHLGISRRTLVYKLGLLDIPRPRKKG